MKGEGKRMKSRWRRGRARAQEKEEEHNLEDSVTYSNWYES